MNFLMFVSNPIISQTHSQIDNPCNLRKLNKLSKKNDRPKYYWELAPRMIAFLTIAGN